MGKVGKTPLSDKFGSNKTGPQGHNIKEITMNQNEVAAIEKISTMLSCVCNAIGNAQQRSDNIETVPDPGHVGRGRPRIWQIKNTAQHDG